MDVDYLVKAQQDPSSNEARVINELTRQAANLNAGEQSYVIYPIAYTTDGKNMFSFELQGVDGGGKQYSTNDIVTRHSVAMLMAFFADVLNLGNDAHGSFSLADSKTSLLAMGIEYHLRNIKKELNHDLIRQTYELNKWDYDPDTSCRFVYGDIEDQDIQALSQALQRVAATGLLRPTDDVENFIRTEWIGLPTTQEASPEFLETKSVSRSGDGMTSGLNNGVGDSTADKDTSTSNLEHE